MCAVFSKRLKSLFALAPASFSTKLNSSGGSLTVPTKVPSLLADMKVVAKTTTMTNTTESEVSPRGFALATRCQMLQHNGLPTAHP
uniref:Secreted protein n=1 Tax=Mesocestoides corti TaxID=53468 RepID=A0A5K3G217_MESCO